MKSIFLGKNEFLDSVYPEYIREQLRNEAGLDESRTIDSSDDYERNAKYLSDVEYVFSTWSFPGIALENMVYFPKLKCVFYAAGSVKGCAAPIIESGRKIFSAWGANAVPVAQFTLSQIILANKGYFLSARRIRQDTYHNVMNFSDSYTGNFCSTVGIIGAGMIGTMVIEELVKNDFKVLVYDPFLSEDRASALGVKKTDLTEIFKKCSVISNHIADNESTRGILNGALFSLMNEHATFINTGRGAQVVESDLINVLKEKPGITALLDVTFPEPPLEGSELYKLDNVFLTPHIAGSKAREHWRLSTYMLEEFRHYIRNEPCKYEITSEILKTMA